jgi:hypothetical protein
LLTQQELKKDVQGGNVLDSVQFSSLERFTEKLMQSFEADGSKVQPGDIFSAVGSGDTMMASLFAAVKTDESRRIAWDALMHEKSWDELLDASHYNRVYKAPTPALLSPRGTASDSKLDEDLLPRIKTEDPQVDAAILYNSTKRNHFAAKEGETLDPCTERLQQVRAFFIDRCKEKNLPALRIFLHCDGLENAFPALDLSSQALRGGYAIAVSVALHALSMLKSIDLTNSSLDNSNAQLILSSLSTNPIEVIILDKNHIGRPGVQALVNLVLNAPRFPVSSLDALVESSKVIDNASNNPRFADLSSNLIHEPGQDSGELKASMLSGNDPSTVRCSIKRLSIKENALGDHLMCKLLQSFVSCSYSHIKELMLRNNDLGIETARLLNRLIQQQCDSACQLELIDLSWNRIKDEGAKLLLDAISESKYMKILNIEWNAITGAIIPTISACLRTSKSLQLLSIRHNSILPNDVRRGIDPELISLEKIVV